MDEFELEVAPLDASAPPADGQGDRVTAVVDDAKRVLASMPKPSTSINVAPLRQRDRVLRASSATGVVLVALVVLLLIPTGTRGEVLRLLLGPTATPTEVLPPPGDRFLWEHTVPWGTLLIDGKSGPDVRSTGASLDQQFQVHVASFRLPRGRHTLDYRAALFPTVHCTVSVPPVASDTCPLDPRNLGMVTQGVAPGESSARMLDFQATVDRLPSEQVQALAAATQATLDAAMAAGQDTVAAGDHLLIADGSPLVANAPLSAQARFSLSESGVLDRPDDVTHCALFCSPSDVFMSSGPDAWTLYAPVALSWRYLRPDGSVALDDGPSVPPGSQVHVAVAVAARWEQRQWQVQIMPAEPRQRDPVICAVGRHGFYVLLASPDQTAGDISSIQWSYEASTPGLGCLFAGGTTFDTAANPTGTVALVLYRCGVLLAVNAEAQRLFPHLPHASAHEQALARAVAPPDVTSSP